MRLGNGLRPLGAAGRVDVRNGSSGGCRQVMLSRMPSSNPATVTTACRGNYQPCRTGRLVPCTVLTAAHEEAYAPRALSSLLKAIVVRRDDE